MGYAAYPNGEIWCAQHYGVGAGPGFVGYVGIFYHAVFTAVGALAAIVLALVVVAVAAMEIRLRRKRKANGTELVSRKQ